MFRMAEEKGCCIPDGEVNFLPFGENGINFLRLWNRIKEKWNLANGYSK